MGTARAQLREKVSQAFLPRCCCCDSVIDILGEQGAGGLFRRERCGIHTAVILRGASKLLMFLKHDNGARLLGCLRVFKGKYGLG